MSNTTKGPFMQAMEKYTKSIKTFISAQGFGHYSKPSGGIPKTDLEQSVQTSLGKADTALQDFTESDPTVPAWAKAASKPSYTASEVGLGKVGNFKAVSTEASQGLSDTEKSNARANIGAGTSSFSGSYNDLSNKPTSLPASDVYSWAKASTKPTYTASEVGAVPSTHPFFTVPINHNMIYRGQNLGATLTDAQHTALSSGNFTDIYLGDYWTKTVTIPTGTYTGGDGKEVTVPAQTNITLKAVIADFDTFYAGDASNYATINTHHAAVIVTGFSNVVWNKTECTAGGYLNSLINKWLVGSALPQIETWFGSAKVLSHQKLLTNDIIDNAASRWTWREQKISLLSENQVYGSKVWGNSKSANGGYEPGEAFKHLNIFNHINPNLLFGKYIWLRDIASAYEASIACNGYAYVIDTANTQIVPAALILLS